MCSWYWFLIQLSLWFLILGIIEYHVPNDPEVSLYRYSIAFTGKAPFENVKSILIAIADAVAVRTGCPGGSALMFPNARAELTSKGIKQRHRLYRIKFSA